MVKWSNFTLGLIISVLIVLVWAKLWTYAIVEHAITSVGEYNSSADYMWVLGVPVNHKLLLNYGSHITSKFVEVINVSPISYIDNFVVNTPLKYTSDKRLITKPPDITLIMGGDCDDQMIFHSVYFSQKNYEVYYVYIALEGGIGTLNHAVLLVGKNNTYVVIDSTGSMAVSCTDINECVDYIKFTYSILFGNDVKYVKVSRVH